jgi:hypothetical protein
MARVGNCQYRSKFAEVLLSSVPYRCPSSTPTFFALDTNLACSFVEPKFHFLFCPETPDTRAKKRANFLLIKSERIMADSISARYNRHIVQFNPVLWVTLYVFVNSPKVGTIDLRGRACYLSSQPMATKILKLALCAVPARAAYAKC